MVLMAIFQDKIMLINHHGVKLAEYPADQVSFCGQGTDNKQFFGLVTSRKIGKLTQKIKINFVAPK